MSFDGWTLALQTVNVLILVWLLQRLFWWPVAGIIEQRRAAVADALAQAEEKQQAAAQAMAEVERQRAGFAQERADIIAAAQASAEQSRAVTLSAAAQRASAMQDSARAAIAAMQEDARKAWSDRAARLSVEIAARLTGRLGGATLHAAFLEGLAREVQALPEATRHAMTQAGLRLRSAAPLSAAQQDATLQALRQALEVPLDVTFEADATLIAGLELHGPHITIANSWQADLHRIEAELTHDQSA